jgi:ATP-dependent DNA helicase RecG
MIYPETESAQLEFKETLPQNQQIIKTIIGFCNHSGGRLIIGVKDDRTIAGVNEKNIQQIIESLQQSIYQNTTPTMLPSIYSQRLHGKMLVIVEVSEGMNKPYFISQKGQSQGTYLRIGAHTMKASAEMIQELTWKSRGFFADEIPVYAGNKLSIDIDKFSAFLKDNRKQYQAGNLDKLLANYKILTQEHQKTYPTMGGVLTFAKNSSQYFPEAFIICSHFKGSSGRNAIASKDCLGDLFTQTNAAIEFVQSCLNQQFTITGTKRDQQLEIPFVALREMIINAVVHRNYQIAAPTKIAVFSDRVEIFSPGNFTGPLSVDQLESGITYIRNHVICRVFREAGYIEKLGSGFLTLFESYRQYQLPRPTIIEGTGYIKCILPRPQNNMPLESSDSDENKIMRLFYVGDEISISDVELALNISRQTASRRLNALIKNNKVQRIGKGPSTKYRKISNE